MNVQPGVQTEIAELTQNIVIEFGQRLIPVGLVEGQSSRCQLILMLAIEIKCAECALLQFAVVLLVHFVGTQIEARLLLVQHKDHALVTHAPGRERWQVLGQHLTLGDLAIGYVGTEQEQRQRERDQVRFDIFVVITFITYINQCRHSGAAEFV